MNIPRLRSKAFEISLGIYPYFVFVCFLDLEPLKGLLESFRYPPTKDEIDDIMQKFSVGGFAAKVIQFDNGNIVMYIPNNLKYRNYMVNMITHECLHITHMIMDRVGMQLNFDNDEAFCYLHGFLCEKIFDQI